jgi:hypothetical protein
MPLRKTCAGGHILKDDRAGLHESACGNGPMLTIELRFRRPRSRHSRALRCWRGFLCLRTGRRSRIAGRWLLLCLRNAHSGQNKEKKAKSGSAQKKAAECC